MKYSQTGLFFVSTRWVLTPEDTRYIWYTSIQYDQ